MSNIYVDRNGIHYRKPVGCRITGQVEAIINGVVTIAYQCDSVKPRPAGYEITHGPKKKTIFFSSQRLGCP